MHGCKEIMPVKNKVQLITYPDSLGGDLSALHRVLLAHFEHLFGGIHILPPYPSSGDRGFAPTTYAEIDPAFGSWSDVQEIGRSHDILLDIMVNHVSRQSRFFRDFLDKGIHSVYADMFLTLDKIWPDGIPVQEDIDKMFLRRRIPYSSYPGKNQDKGPTVWTTFGKQDPSEQIDIDVNSEVTRDFLSETLSGFSRNLVRIVRLDAIGYVVKKPGTSCFFIEPEVFDFLEWISSKARAAGIELLPEVHSHYTIQYKLAEKGYWIYDFILPYLLLEALVTRSGTRLCRYLQTRPPRQFTMLDCHDGVPVKPDLDGLVPAEDARHLAEVCVNRGANLSLVFSDKHKSPDGFDVHQIRCSYYSMLDCNDDAYIAARAIQFFTPGIPQVYYVGLLAGENDHDRVKETGEGREINRHNYSMEEIGKAVKKPVVKRLLDLIRFRNSYPAFEGDFMLEQTSDSAFSMKWEMQKYSCTLHMDLTEGRGRIQTLDEKGENLTIDI